MNNQVFALQIAAVVFLVVCLGHVLRLIFRIKVTIGNFVVPLWFSLVGILVSLSLSLWMISITKN